MLYGKLAARAGMSYLINASIGTAILLLGYSYSIPLLIMVALLWKLGSIPTHSWMIALTDRLDASLSAVLLTITKLGLIIALGIFASSVSSGLLITLSFINLVLGSLISLVHYRYVRALT